MLAYLVLRRMKLPSHVAELTLAVAAGVDR